MSLSSVSVPARVFHPAWSQSLSSGVRGLALARESGMLLIWDDQGSLYLLNRRGERQAHRPMPYAVAFACSADDGSAHVAIGPEGEICWLTPDLTQRWQKTSSNPILGAALDPFGQYLAVADRRGKLYVLNCQGSRVLSTETPRPLHYLAFVPKAPFLVGTADFGLAACFDLSGKCVWRAGLVAHAGALAVSGDGSVITLACFTEGLQRYNLAGQSLGRWNLNEPCRLAALAFDGNWTLASGLGQRLLLLDRSGRTVTHHDLELPCVGLALAALGEAAYAALPDGRVLALDLRPG